MPQYDAFISYSHDADGRIAPAVQRGLQHLARPLFAVRSLRVFRDNTGLSVTPHLWGSIQEALENSQYFVVLASRESAKSLWVARELEFWLDHMSMDRILPVLTDGDIVWDEARNDFDPVVSTAVHPVLRTRFTEEPLYLDLRWARDARHLTLRNHRFRDAMAELAAPIHQLSKDELQSEEVHRYRRRVALAWGAATSLATVIATSVALAIFLLHYQATAAAAQAQVHQLEARRGPTPVRVHLSEHATSKPSGNGRRSPSSVPGQG
jgi:hypothetical protein